MKKFLVLLAISTICFSCSKEEKIVRNNLQRDQSVLILQTGNVELPIKSYRHSNPGAWGGGKLTEHIYISNNPFMGRIIDCIGCDSCMTAYANAGLITYDVLRKDEISVNANVQLTSKGLQYDIENILVNNQTVKDYKEKGIYLVLSASEKIGAIENIYVASDKEFYCDLSFYDEFTPFGEVLGGVTNKQNSKYKEPITYRCYYDRDGNIKFEGHVSYEKKQ